jgi:hypothetical protein
VRLELEPHREPILQDPGGQARRIEDAVHRRKQDRRRAAHEPVTLHDRLGELVVLAILITNLTSSRGVSRSRFGQWFFAASPLPGHFTSTTRTTSSGTRSMLRWPPVSSSTVWPREELPHQRIDVLLQERLAAGVISTTGQPNASTSDTTSSTVIFRPSWKAYAVSHQEHLRSHAVRRTKTQGRPVWVDSPWIE